MATEPGKGDGMGTLRIVAIALGILLGGLGGMVIGFLLWASGRQHPEASYAQVMTYDRATGAEPPNNALADTLTVVTYNLGYLSGLGNAAGEGSPEITLSPAFFAENQRTAIAALTALSPDILALQEVDIHARRSHGVDQAAALATGLGLPQGAIAVNWDKRYIPFPYWPPADHFGPTLSAQAILSRFPITAHHRHVLAPVAGQTWLYRAFYLDRLAQVTEITLGNRSVVIINVHLEAFDEPTRRQQTEYVRTLGEGYAANFPVIVLGDFNSALNRPEEGHPATLEVMLDSPQLQPAVDPAQFTTPEQFTFPSDQPAYRLDYGFYTPATLELLQATVITPAAQASDHLPVALEFRLH